MALQSDSALTKAAILGALALLLLLPLHMLAGLVAERTSMRDSAVQTVARGWGDRQWVGGPIVAIPVTTDANPDHPCDWYVLPETLSLSGELRVEDAKRRVGIYEVPVYVARIRAQGAFDLGRQIARLTRGDPSYHLNLEQARILLPTSDPRGLRSVSAQSLPVSGDFEPASGFVVSALAAPLARESELLRAPRAFDMTYEVAGTESLAFLPFARTLGVQLHGNWPDPGFTEGVLPLEHGIAASGFTARWQVLNLNRAYGDRWFAGGISEQGVKASGFGVDLVQPVDLYQRTTRAVKYAGLFIALTWLTLSCGSICSASPSIPFNTRVSSMMVASSAKSASELASSV